MNAVSVLVGRWRAFEEFPDLRSGEALESARSGERRQPRRSAHRVRDLGALLGRRRVHPDGRRVTREDARQLVGERTVGIELGEPGTERGVEVDAAVLLRRTGDGADRTAVDAARREVAEQPVERLGPHERRRVRDERIVGRQHAVPRAVRRQVAVEDDLALEDDPAVGAVDGEDNRRQALSAAVEAEVQAHVSDHQGVAGATGPFSPELHHRVVSDRLIRGDRQ